MIFHIAVASEWASDDPASYRPSDFDDEGFIHCSTRSQLVETANLRFANRTDLILVTIDESSLDAPVVWEDLDDTGISFPHIYGPINADAVIETTPFVSDANGRFDWWVDR
jgi:uncharacterized protein (DUF952 family)